MEEIIVRKIPLPLTTKGLVSLDSEGDYNIYLNSAMTHEMNLQTLEHELRHINHAHFYSLEDVKKLEE